MRRFVVIDGGAPERSDEQTADRVELWQCRKCEARQGLPTSSLMEVISAPKLVDGKLVDGLRQLVCAYCWREGVYTPVVTDDHE